MKQNYQLHTPAAYSPSGKSIRHSRCAGTNKSNQLDYRKSKLGHPVYSQPLQWYDRMHVKNLSIINNKTEKTMQHKTWIYITFYLLNGEFKRMWKKVVMAYLTQYPGICLGGQIKIMKSVSHDINPTQMSK